MINTVVNMQVSVYGISWERRFKELTPHEHLLRLEEKDCPRVCQNIIKLQGTHTHVGRLITRWQEQCSWRRRVQRAYWTEVLQQEGENKQLLEERCDLTLYEVFESESAVGIRLNRNNAINQRHEVELLSWTWWSFSSLRTPPSM
jgi:hypothetical protein